MADVPVWHFFAYFDGDAEGERDEHRHVPDWRVNDVVRWATSRGYDTIMLTRTGEAAGFIRRPPVLDHDFPAAR